MKLSIFTAWNDAGLLREYVANRFGRLFTYGGSVDEWRRSYGPVNRLRALTGLSRDQIQKAAVEDYAAAH